MCIGLGMALGDVVDAIDVAGPGASVDDVVAAFAAANPGASIGPGVGAALTGLDPEVGLAPEFFDAPGTFGVLGLDAPPEFSFDTPAEAAAQSGSSPSSGSSETVGDAVAMGLSTLAGIALGPMGMIGSLAAAVMGHIGKAAVDPGTELGDIDTPFGSFNVFDDVFGVAPPGGSPGAAFGVDPGLGDDGFPERDEFGFEKLPSALRPPTFGFDPAAKVAAPDPAQAVTVPRAQGAPVQGDGSLADWLLIGAGLVTVLD